MTYSSAIMTNDVRQILDAFLHVLELSDFEPIGFAIREQEKAGTSRSLCAIVTYPPLPKWLYNSLLDQIAREKA